MTRDICLHLVLPKSLEEPVIDELLRHQIGRAHV